MMTLQVPLYGEAFDKMEDTQKFGSILEFLSNLSVVKMAESNLNNPNYEDRYNLASSISDIIWYLNSLLEFFTLSELKNNTVENKSSFQESELQYWRKLDRLTRFHQMLPANLNPPSYVNCNNPVIKYLEKNKTKDENYVQCLSPAIPEPMFHVIEKEIKSRVAEKVKEDFPFKMKDRVAVVPSYRESRKHFMEELINLSEASENDFMEQPIMKGAWVSLFRHFVNPLSKSRVPLELNNIYHSTASFFRIGQFLESEEKLKFITKVLLCSHCGNVDVDSLKFAELLEMWTLMTSGYSMSRVSIFQKSDLDAIRNFTASDSLRSYSPFSAQEHYQGYFASLMTQKHLRLMGPRVLERGRKRMTQDNTFSKDQFLVPYWSTTQFKTPKVRAKTSKKNNNSNTRAIHSEKPFGSHSVSPKKSDKRGRNQRGSPNSPSNSPNGSPTLTPPLKQSRVSGNLTQSPMVRQSPMNISENSPVTPLKQSRVSGNLTQSPVSTPLSNNRRSRHITAIPRTEQVSPEVSYSDVVKNTFLSMPSSPIVDSSSSESSDDDDYSGYKRVQPPDWAYMGEDTRYTLICQRVEATRKRIEGEDDDDYL